MLTLLSQKYVGHIQLDILHSSSFSSSAVRVSAWTTGSSSSNPIVHVRDFFFIIIILLLHFSLLSINYKPCFNIIMITIYIPLKDTIATLMY